MLGANVDQHSKATLSNTMTTGHILLFKLGLIKILKINSKFSLSFIITTFQVLSSHEQEATTKLGQHRYRTFPSLQKIIIGLKVS